MNAFAAAFVMPALAPAFIFGQALGQNTMRIKGRENFAVF
jgi:hypothetical protein